MGPNLPLKHEGQGRSARHLAHYFPTLKRVDAGSHGVGIEPHLQGDSLQNTGDIPICLWNGVGLAFYTNYPDGVGDAVNIFISHDLYLSAGL